jgi:hypothetical protein
MGRGWGGGKSIAEKPEAGLPNKGQEHFFLYIASFLATCSRGKVRDKSEIHAWWVTK